MNKELLTKHYNEAMSCSGFENKETDTEYRLDINNTDKTITLSFQGSSNFIVDDKLAIDWKQNFNFWHKPYKNMKHTFFVHKGIFLKYKSVQDEIFEKIKDLKHYDMKIYGFSQGGGLTLFAHEDYWFKGFNPTSYPFAAPMVFVFWNSKVLKERFENCHTIYNVNDIVSKAPFWWTGFRKYGKKIKLGKKKLLVPPWKWYEEHMTYRALFY